MAAIQRRLSRELVLALPLCAYFAAFLIFPVLYALRLSLTADAAGGFPTLENFTALFRDTLFRQALLGNVVVPLGSLLVELVAGLALALAMAQRFRGRGALRMFVVLPFAVPQIVFLTVMRYILAPRGYLNGALAAAGIGPIAWLEPGSALAYTSVVLVDAWHITPVVFLVLLTGLAAIPDEIQEAAELDGARGWRRLVFIVLPLLRPAIVAAVLLRGVDAMRVFATPLVLTGVEGVPVLSTYAYHQWSDYGSDGMAAAAATVLAALAVTASVPVLRRARRSGDA